MTSSIAMSRPKTWRGCSTGWTFTPAVAAAHTGIVEADLIEMLAAIRGVGKIAPTTGTGLAFGRHAMLAQWLRWVVLIDTGSGDREGGMWVDAGWYNPSEQRRDWAPASLDAVPAAAPSRPDLPKWFGEVPCVALIDEIEQGRVRGLFINGGSPLTAIPNPDRLRAALKTLEFLAVVDVVENELTETATHVLPSAAILERADITGGWSHHMAYNPRLLPLGGDHRPSWWIFGQLGKRLGLDVLDGLDPDITSDEEILHRTAGFGRRPADEPFAAGPRGMLIPVRCACALPI